MRRSLLLIVAAAVLGGCVQIPKDLFQTKRPVTEIRSLEARKFEGGDKEAIYAASAAALQDLGFSLSETDADLGLLVGSKDRDATDAGQVVLAVFVALLGGGATAVDKNQRFFVSVVVQEMLDSFGNPIANQLSVRATFSRKVWNTRNDLTRAEQLVDPKLYSGFFDKLSKSVFLEAQQI